MVTSSLICWDLSPASRPCLEEQSWCLAALSSGGRTLLLVVEDSWGGTAAAGPCYNTGFGQGAHPKPHLFRLVTSLTGSSGNTFRPLHRRTEGLQLGWAGEIKRERNFRRLGWRESKRHSTIAEHLLSMCKALGLTLSTS